MTQISINWNDLKRNLSIDFDIEDINTSYEVFCKNDNLSDTIKEFIEKKDLETPFLNLNLLNPYLSAHIWDKLAILLYFDINEEYIGLWEIFWDIAWEFILDDSEENLISILKRKGVFFDSDLNNFLTFVKGTINNNFFLKEPIKNKEFESKMGFHMWDYIPQILDEEVLNLFAKRNKKISKKIIYKEKILKNKRMEYIVFLSLLISEDLYIIIEEFNNRFTIVSEKNIWKYIWKNVDQFSIIKKLDIFSELNEKDLNIIIKMRNQYVKNQNSLEEIIEHIKEFIEKWDNWELLLSFHQNSPTYMKWKFSTTDFNKYQELETFTQDCWYVAFNKHRGVKTNIVWEKRYKYKEDKKSWKKSLK